MLIPVPPSDCMRAREAASRRLDDELTELESTRLDTHLRRCPDCRALVAEIAAITTELRRTPLETATIAVFQPRRRRPVRAVRLSAVAAAVAAVAIVGGGSFTLGRELGGSGNPGAFTSSTANSDVTKARDDSVEQRLLALLPGPRREQPPHVGVAVAL
jgi:predicted anti-sigma-YlaC factor YlaD